MFEGENHDSMESLKKSNSLEELEYSRVRAKAGEYIKGQHPIIRSLHAVLQGFSYLTIALAVILFAIALYYTILWVITGSFTSLGAATYLPNAWVNFGLSCSFMVFPWGLDSMLMRWFPALIFPHGLYRSSKPIRIITGLRAFFAGFGIMCAGAPGAVYIIGLAVDVLKKLF